MEDSCQDRQENEKAALKAIYNEEMKELSECVDGWRPLECILTLGPQGSMGPRRTNTPTVQLHIACSQYYPDEEPHIAIDSCKGLSNENTKILLHQLIEKTKNLKGEVVIFELAQHVENFLHQYNQPGFESFYEEMVTRQRSELEKELQKRQADEERKREEILLEIQCRQMAAKAEKKALRRRRSSLRNNDDPPEDQDIYKISPKHKGEKTILPESRKGDNDENIEVNGRSDLDDYTVWNFSSKGQSRFETEFEHIKWLGKGAFGDVIKVKNKLDDGLYAVKRIQLNPMNIQLNKKITREVKLLSRLNHENVVRYYNSWIESAVVEVSYPGDVEPSLKSEENINNMMIAMLPRKEPSLDWNTKPAESSEDSSDDECWITFKSASNGDEVDAACPSSTQTYGEDSQNDNTLQYMYIQMELCEKSTLRSSIDESLYSDIQRVWRLFREIVEGLCHIHQQGIIHRDLKPVNIFIDNDDHVKIGDFGLATTSIWHKQTAVRDAGYSVDIVDKQESITSTHLISQTGDLSQTGQIGTALYVAPELKSRTTKLPYNQKVDIFSLGIIFFEMCHAPLKTGMERYKMLTDLRQKTPVFPSDFLYDSSSHQHCLIRWMLKHDAKERPSSQQLLQSEHIPPPELEEAEVREMVRHTISNPQSKDYKHLIASCFKQVPSPALDATYDQSSGRSLPFIFWYEFVSEKLRKIFWRHGAISLLPPLLTPAVSPAETSVCLMTRGGGIVYTSYDLRTPFARYLARNSNITNIKRYAMDKVYREKRVHGFHPKEMFECAFDIVTPTAGDLMPESEMLSVIWEILQEFPSLLRKNCTIHFNHTHLITAMLRHCGLDQEKQKNVCFEIYKAKNEYRSRPELESHLKSLDLPEHTITTLINFINTEGPLRKVHSFLLSTLKDNGLITLCKQGFRHLESVVSNCETLGIMCTIVVTLGLMQNAHIFSGIMCQVVLDQKTKQKHLEHNVIISGGRYDALLHTCRKALHVVTEGSQSVTGFILSLDKFINALFDQGKPSAIDVLVCSLGQSQMSADKLGLIKDLWRSGLKTSFVNTIQSLEEIKTYCQDLSIPNIVILKDTEPGFARIGVWVKERFQEKKIAYSEVLEYLFKVMKNSSLEVTQTVKMLSPTESSIITFIDKPTYGAKRRYISQIWNSLSSTLQRLSNKVRVEIFALNLEKEAVRKLWHCFESDTKDQDINLLREEFPRHKRCLNKVIDQIESSKNDDHSVVIILYSLPDNIFKILL